ncbi:MAG: hypothetical protein LAT57_07705 [Balneolales bacterium]|nr:hypothetical protein [Balneolales bacterium]
MNLEISGCRLGSQLRIGKNTKISVRDTSKVIIGNNVVIGEDVYINVKANATLLIGNNVHINKGTRISSNEKIEIGDDTLIAPYCNILDHNHVYDLQKPVSVYEFENKQILIGKGVWLGVRVQVNKGVRIGDYCVVGANAVVTKDIQESSVYGGIPAKLIKSL